MGHRIQRDRKRVISAPLESVGIDLKAAQSGFATMTETRKHDPPGGRIRSGEQSGGRWVQRRRSGEAGAEHFLSVGEIDRTITDSDNAQSNADR